MEKWSELIADIDKHWDLFKSGKDFHGKLNVSHLSLIKMKLEKLQGYYRTNPQGDDRPKSYLKPRKIGLDIDEVLAGWLPAWCERHGINVDGVHSWAFDHRLKERFEEMKDDKEFWLSIKPLIQPKDLPFEPHCYITARSIPKEWTEEWLYSNGFPTVPVYSVGFGVSKVQVAKESGIEVFVDDNYKNFCELNNAGILTYLYDAPHNRKYDVGYMRIFDLNELV